MNNTQGSGGAELGPVGCTGEPLQVLSQEVVASGSGIHEGVGECDCGMVDRKAGIEHILKLKRYIRVSQSTRLWHSCAFQTHVIAHKDAKDAHLGVLEDQHVGVVIAAEELKLKLDGLLARQDRLHLGKLWLRSVGSIGRKGVRDLGQVLLCCVVLEVKCELVCHQQICLLSSKSNVVRRFSIVHNKK